MINLEKAGDVAIIVVDHPRLDASSAMAFHIEAAQAMEGSVQVILDFAKVEFMDSTGIGALVGVTKSRRGATIIMCGLTPAVEAIFKLLRMDMVFKVAPDRAGALAHLSGA